jgi:hypothetical protein
MNRGRCVMLKKKHIHRGPDGRILRKTGAYYDGAGNNVPGLQDGYAVPEDLALPADLDLMLAAAGQIAAGFDHLRVDFIALHEGPALGELTLCTMNARITYSEPALEALAREAVRVNALSE